MFPRSLIFCLSDQTLEEVVIRTTARSGSATDKQRLHFIAQLIDVTVFLNLMQLRVTTFSLSSIRLRRRAGSRSTIRDIMITPMNGVVAVSDDLVDLVDVEDTWRLSNLCLHVCILQSTSNCVKYWSILLRCFDATITCHGC